MGEVSHRGNTQRMKSLSKELLDRSVLAMVAAIEIYNKPGISYRNESFTILAINAWELSSQGQMA